MTAFATITGIVIRIIANVEDIYEGLREDTFWLLDGEIDTECEDIHVFFINGKEINIFPHEYELATAEKYPLGFFQWAKVSRSIEAKLWPLAKPPIQQFGYPDHYAVFRRDCGPFVEVGTGFNVVNAPLPEAAQPAPLEAPKKAPRTSEYPAGSQKAQILDHLTKGKTLTRITADHLYRVASLTKRISELKADGFPIKAIVKVDETGRPYTEYSLRNSKGLR